MLNACLNSAVEHDARNRDLTTDDFDFELPPDLIATAPAGLVIRAYAEVRSLSDRTVSDLPDLLRPEDVLVINDTRVIPPACGEHAVVRN